MSDLTPYSALEYAFEEPPVRELRADRTHGLIRFARLPLSADPAPDALGELGHTIVSVHLDGDSPSLLPRPIVRHSPTGFEWGYGGSGPADLAANVLAYFCADLREAWRLHQRFKESVIGPLPRDGSTLPFNLVRGWLQSVWRIEREDQRARELTRAELEEAPYLCPVCTHPSSDKEGHSGCLARLNRDTALQGELYPDGQAKPERPMPITTEPPSLPKVEQGRVVYGG
jgi:hypothetical protein